MNKADNFQPPKGRRTIRRAGPVGIDPMKPAARENRVVRLWSFEAKSGSTMAKLQDSYLSALGAVDAVEDRKANAAKSGKFTEAGARDDALAFALNEAVPTFKRGRDAIAAAKREAAALREKIKLREPDKTDVAGALMRREIRDTLKAMRPEDRDKFISRNLSDMEPTVAEAILTAPAWLTDVSPTHRQLLMDKALQAQHGDAVAQVQQLERAIEYAASAVETGRDEVRLLTGSLDPVQFDSLAAPIEKKVAAPWLKKFTEDGTEVVRTFQWDTTKKSGVWAKATPEDLETGVFYATADDYQRANPSWAA
jgi:hypothetical protein